PVGLADVSPGVPPRGPGRRGAVRQRGEQPARLAVRLPARVRAVSALRSGPVAVGRQGSGEQRPAILSSGGRPGSGPPSQARPGLPKVFVSVTGKRGDRQRLVVLAADTS